MIDLDPFLAISPESPFLFLVGTVESAAKCLVGCRRAGLTARSVRGGKMRTVDGVFDEIASAFQFPYYFGENWAAFDECLSDMDWLPMDVGIVVVVFNAGDVLADDLEVEFRVLVKYLRLAAETYAAPIELGEPWDRPAVPFHVVLHELPDRAEEVRGRWKNAGAVISDF